MCIIHIHLLSNNLPLTLVPRSYDHSNDVTQPNPRIYICIYIYIHIYIYTYIYIKPEKMNIYYVPLWTWQDCLHPCCCADDHGDSSVAAPWYPTVGWRGVTMIDTVGASKKNRIIKSTNMSSTVPDGLLTSGSWWGQGHNSEPHSTRSHFDA
jgi:hypothetical protein